MSVNYYMKYLELCLKTLLQSLKPHFAKPDLSIAKLDLSILESNQAIAKVDLSIAKPDLSIVKLNDAIAEVEEVVAKENDAIVMLNEVVA